ncbi:lipid droplet-associated protein [Williamsia phyllosphaerae]|uniref:Lipid droplet-associated protein n=1 Tax=Williamsia phyllosphaerae TaxID=885042 RepID=A0ABQ1UZV4_9NOCA|nr:lipid droplet-associated protein [Williamsia phyllosphaerae]GGF32416.1 hypothetical protein GCM10007298_30360 [Williamsia phyllosphaerae]
MIRPPFAARVVTGLIVTALEETRKLPSTAVTLPMTAVSQTLQAGMRFQQGIAELAIKGDEVLDALFHRAQEEPEWATFDDDAPADVTHDPKSQPPSGSGSASGTATVTPITAAPTATAATGDTTTPSATPGHIPTAPDEPTPADMPSEQADTVEPTPPVKAAKAPAKKAAAKKAPAAKKPAPAKAAPPKPSADESANGDGAPSNTGRFALYSSAPENVVRSDVEATPIAPSADAPEIVEYLDYDGLTLAQLRSKIRSVDLDDLQALADYERSHRGRAPFQTMLDNRITAAAGK